jgi:hypothetical protein
MRSKTTKVTFLFFVALLLEGCATRPAPEISGRWKSLNRYPETTQEIPLSRAYVFSASPLDGTLKTMLERWARDCGKTLSWLPPSDFTLSAPVADIHTSELQDAVRRLNAIYSPQQLLIVIDGSQIAVGRAGSNANMDRGSSSATGT